MVGFKSLFGAVSVAVALAGVKAADSLKDIEHVVFFMQENRAFDHYFGTMAGVRGFQDPNVQMHPNNKSVFTQPVDSSIKPAPPKDVKELMYFYVGQAGGHYSNSTQCMVGGSNGWEENHAAWNNGKNDGWALHNTPYSLAYYKRKELPVHFALAEEFIVGDSYHESVTSASDTNRAVWISGTINSPGSTPGGEPTKQGGPVVDDHRAAGCEKDSRGNPVACLPLKWKTIPEYLEEQNISWLVYEDTDNGYHNMLEQFEQYEHDIINQGPLAKKGIYRPGLNKFMFDLKNGSLPQVSYIITPIELSEHPPYTPNDGAWIQSHVANSLMKSQYWNRTVMIMNYDETGGFADHVMSPLSPKGTDGEWMEDPFDHKLGQQPVGPGYRVPFYVVSPWTRKGGVFTEIASHDSCILFLEKWSAAHGKNWTSKELNPWRRKHMSDLMSVFDFSKRDMSVPRLPHVSKASKDPVTWKWNGVPICQARYNNDNQPPVPYGNQTELKNGFEVEKGYKRVRGSLTEGRHLVFETYNMALTVKDGKLQSGKACSKKDDKKQMFVLHWLGKEPKDGRGFRISTQADKKKFLTKDLTFSSKEDDAVEMHFTDKGNGLGHVLSYGKKYLTQNQDGKVEWVDSNPTTFSIYSVTF